MSPNNIMMLFIYYLQSVLHLTSGIETIRAIPSTVIKKGGNVTIQCSSDSSTGAFRLYIKNNSGAYRDEKGNGRVANFTFTNVNDNDSGHYRCLYSYWSGWSNPDNDIQLKIIDPRSPAISVSYQELSEEKKVIINCTAPDPPKEVTVLKFFLHSNGQNNRIRDFTAKGSLHAVFRRTFFSCKENFSCSYVLKVKEEPQHQIESEVSDYLQPTECNTTEPLAETTPTASTDITTNMTTDLATTHGQSVTWVAVISTLCGVLVLLILVIVLICIFRKKKTSKQKMKTSEYPQSADAETTNDATYSSVEDSKNIVPPNMEVNMQDSNVDDDEITYAILNNATRNKSAVSKKADETSLYAEVKKSIKK